MYRDRQRHDIYFARHRSFIDTGRFSVPGDFYSGVITRELSKFSVIFLLHTDDRCECRICIPNRVVIDSCHSAPPFSAFRVLDNCGVGYYVSLTSHGFTITHRHLSVFTVMSRSCGEAARSNETYDGVPLSRSRGQLREAIKSHLSPIFMNVYPVENILRIYVKNERSLLIFSVCHITRVIFIYCDNIF